MRLARDAAQPSDILYFDLSDMRVVDPSIRQLAEQIGVATGTSRRRVLLLDEVGYDPAWQRAVKHLVDLGDRAPLLVVSDSVATRLKLGDFQESALGRRQDVALEPMTLPEVARYRGIGAGSDGEADGLRLGLMADEYLVRGGMPDAILTAKPLTTVHAELREQAEIAVRHDTGRVGQVRDVDALRKLWTIAAKSASFAPKVSKLANAIGVDRRTVANHIRLLCDIELLRRLPSSGKAAMTTARHPTRLVVADAGIAAAHFLRAELAQPDRLGMLVEVAVLQHLAPLQSGPDPCTLHYARYQAAGKTREVDFVVRFGNGDATAIEVKYGPVGGEQRRKRALAERCVELGASLGLLVTRHPQTELFNHQGVAVWSVPLWRMLCQPWKLVRGELDQ